jgi:ethanolamine utilization protein EutQ (cupin superfamily)
LCFSRIDRRTPRPQPSQGVTKLTADDVETWYRSGERRLFLADVLDASNSDSMSVGFARYAPGEANDWLVTYDEALGRTSLGEREGRIHRSYGSSRPRRWR